MPFAFPDFLHAAMSDTIAQPGLDSLSKSFEPSAIEAQWGPEWEKRGYGNAGYRGTGQPGAEATAAGNNFAIQLPPPNVTGTLHMGHAFNQTIMDSLTRYHRMKGYNTAWIPGTDHAGIATQIVVERQLQTQGVSRYDLGRDEFTKKVWEWKEKSGNTITTQMRRMGDTVDWSREYFTMDDKLSKVVTETFVKLYQQGLIYRGKRLVNWDPVLQSAVSDLEVENQEKDGSLWHIAYPLTSGEGNLVVATTRPETLLGDTAVAVHPDPAAALDHQGFDAAFGEPGRQQARLVRWRIDVVALQDGFRRRIDIDQRKRRAVAEVNGQFAFGEWDGEFHFESPGGGKAVVSNSVCRPRFFHTSRMSSAHGQSVSTTARSWICARVTDGS